MIDLHDPRIKRFPRLYPGKKRKKLPTDKAMKLRYEAGIMPKGYNKLTKRQKKLARMVVNGETVTYACRKLGFDTNTFYRYMNYHKLFKRYYINYGESIARNVEGRLDAKLTRAVRVIEDTLDGPDPYHRHEAAIKLLAGRGKYKKNVVSKNQVAGRIDLTNQAPEKPMNQEIVFALVDAMKSMAMGTKELRPKIIDAEVVKQLPAETVITEHGNTQVQEVQQEKAS